MNILTILLIGLVAGFLAGKLVEGHSFGTAGDIAVGIFGALVGAPFFAMFGAEAYGFLGAVLMSTFGASMVLIAADIARATFSWRKTANG